MTFSDAADQFRCEFRCSGSSTMGGSLGMESKAISISTRLSSLAITFFEIIYIGSWFKVLSAHARWPIAFVKRTKWSRIVTVFKKKCNAMSADLTGLFEPKSPVSILVVCGCPTPTFAGWSLAWSFVNLRPESANVILEQWWKWFRLLMGHSVLLFRSLMNRVALTRFSVRPSIVAV